MAPTENSPTDHSPTERLHTQPGPSEPLFGTEDAGHSETAPEPLESADGRPRGAPVARTGTVVWGLIVVVLGLGAMAVAMGRSVDIEVALISLFLIAGLGLLAGSAISAAQRSRRNRGRP